MGRRRSVLLYDGDCMFCNRSVDLGARMGARVDFQPWQRADLDTLGVSEERAQREVVLVAPNGRTRSGASAVAALLWTCPGPWRYAGPVLDLPGVRTVAELVYRLISDNRHRLAGWLG